MNREEYIQQREALLTEAREAKANQDSEKMGAALDKVEKLDSDYTHAVIEAKNNKAMATEPKAVNLENMSRQIVGGKVVETMENENRTVTFTAESKEYHEGFLKKLQGKPLSEIEMQAVSVVAPGVIPTETVNKIFGKLQDAPLLGAINLMNIPGNISIPVEGTVNDASWLDMGAASTDSADTVDDVDLGAFKLIKTVEITADLKAMSIPAFEKWLIDRLSKKIRIAVDAAVCTGNGSGKATGLLHAGQITTDKTFTAKGMTYAELMGIIGALPSQYLPCASFVMPGALFWSDIEGMVDASGKPIVTEDPAAPAKYRIKGFPTIIDDNMTEDNLVFGDLEGYTFNFAQAPTVARDESVGFRSGTTCFRAMALGDGKVVDKKGFVKAHRGV